MQPNPPSNPLPPRPRPRMNDMVKTSRAAAPASPLTRHAAQPLEDDPSKPLTSVSLSPAKKSPSLKKRLWLIIGSAVLLLVVAAVGVIVWYNYQLGAPGSKDSPSVRLVIASGASPDKIATQLQDQGVIRSATAFDIYTRLGGVRDKLQAGSYNLSPSQSTPDIVTHLTSGKSDEFNLTFLPGGTVSAAKVGLERAGYSKAEIDAAFAKTYDHPIFEGKPSSADLEGYIYGETYNFNSDATVEQILVRTFDQFYSVVKNNDLVAKFKAQGLSLYQGITLASIIQREVPTAGDQKQVAQVFYLRLATNMTLGSDVTYQYIADKLGVPRDPRLDSPYNTRRYPGLPPGPIATPGLGALQAVANPTPGDYLFFLSGDDNKTYFARTNAEHEANVRDHCQSKCQIL